MSAESTAAAYLPTRSCARSRGKLSTLQEPAAVLANVHAETERLGERVALKDEGERQDLYAQRIGQLPGLNHNKRKELTEMM